MSQLEALSIARSLLGKSYNTLKLCFTINAYNIFRENMVSL